ncbi:MAG: tripartite tricarboxylate transporter substrate binding protein, partial [Pseudomonadota bacterium]
MKTRSFLKALGLLAALPASSVLAQSGRPIRMVVPLPAGTATDLAARVLAQNMSTILGETIVVDNKPGGNGTIG